MLVLGHWAKGNILAILFAMTVRACVKAIVLTAVSRMISRLCSRRRARRDDVSLPICAFRAAAVECAHKEITSHRSLLIECVASLRASIAAA